MSENRPPSRAFALFVGVLLGPGAGHFAAGLVARGRFFSLLSLAAVAAAGFALRPLARRFGIDHAMLGVVAGLASLAVIAAIDLARADTDDFSHAGRPWLVLQLGAVAAIVLAIPLGVRVYLLDLFRVPSRSMEPTLAVGDLFVVERGAYAAGRSPKRGDVIVFRPPENRDELYVKRVVGLGGDRVETVGHHVFVNGVELPRCEIGRFVGDDPLGTHLSVEWIDAVPFLILEGDDDPRALERKAFEVKPGEVFMIGDNRDDSLDSRFWLAGKGAGVPLPDIVGRAWRVMLSPTPGRVASRVDALRLPLGADALEMKLRECLATPRASAIPTP